MVLAFIAAVATLKVTFLLVETFIPGGPAPAVASLTAHIGTAAGSMMVSAVLRQQRHPSRACVPPRLPTAGRRDAHGAGIPPRITGGTTRNTVGTARNAGG